MRPAGGRAALVARPARAVRPVLAAAALLALAWPDARLAAPARAQDRAAPVAALESPALVDSAFLDQYAATYRFRLGRPVSPQPSPDGRTVLFLRSGPRSFVQDLWEFDVATGRERALLTAEQILRGAEERLTPEERARRERLRSAARGIAAFQVSDDGRRILVPLSGRLFAIERATGVTRELESAAGAAEDPRFSPDGAAVACARDGDLYVTEVATGMERRVTTRENESVSYGVAEFVAQEEMDRFEGYWWSPDSKWIACQRTDTREVERFHILDPGHPERPPQSWPYPRPGKSNADVTLGLHPAAGGPAIPVTWDRARWPYLARVAWPKNAPLTLVVMNRAQTEEAVLAVEPGHGTTRALHIERDPAWLNLDERLPRWLEDGSGFLWATERSGAWQLELRGRDGRPLRTLTPAALNYRGFVGVSAARGSAWVMAGEDPARQDLYRIPLRGGAPVRVTAGAGVHDVGCGADPSIFVDTFDALSGDRRVTVLRADGGVAGVLSSVAEKPALPPRIQLATAGGRRLRAVLVRPHDFDPRRRYPVIVYVYGGPHTQLAMARATDHVLSQWLADQGFVVVSLDGRGTPARGRAWERAIRGDFMAAPLADQVDGLRALAARHHELDLERVGIWGASFGGYFTCMAVMRRPDVFKAGVALAPVTDWRDYDTFYTERYLGLLPGDSLAYTKSSVLTYAQDLERPLLLIHGTADDNVYLVHSLKLSDALTRAGRHAEVWPMVGQAHGIRDPLLAKRMAARLATFFTRELGAPR
jgi:dipeptidyl-peptidase-4